MKHLKLSTALTLFFAFLLFSVNAQISNWRAYDQEGVNVFEPAKETDAEFDGLKVRVGGAFAQQYQALDHSNSENIPFDTVMYRGNPVNANQLYALAPGFNLATANMYVDVQLEDGIRLAVESYMSSRHHEEFWVKGGFIQIDKLPMFDNSDWFDDNFRVKIGHFQVNYGDQQFRRTDNGNAMYNPFVGNTILDAFATEIGGEVYFFVPNSDLMLMVGATSGYINGNIQEGDNRNPSIYAKAAFDKQFNDDLRFRLSGSIYTNAGVGRNTLYQGDRAGSRYYLAMEPAYYQPRGSSSYSTANATGLFTSGRVSPGFTSEVTSIMINPFLKYQGFELFGTFEMASGLSYSDPRDENQMEPDARDITNIGVEGVYRFLKNEQLYLGVRYNNVSGPIFAGIRDIDNNPVDVSVDRLAIAAGWYPIKNLLLKVEYVQQNYNDFPIDNERYNIFNEGEFNGVVIEAVVGF